MAISFIGQNQSATTTVTIPGATQVGDIIIIFAYRNTTTAPTLPTGYTSIFTQSANGNSMRMGYKFAVGSDTSGTWTNANVLQVVVYRGVSGIGGSGSTTNASASTTTVSGIGTMTVTDGSSWAVSGAGSLQTTSMAAIGSTTQRGTTQAGTTSMALIGDSNGGVSSWAQHTSAVGTNAAGAGGSTELLAAKMLFCDPGGDADGGVGLLLNAASGTTAVVASQTQVNGTHLYSYLFSKASGSSYAEIVANTHDAGGRFSQWIYVTNYPSALNTMYIGLTAVGGSVVWELRMNTDGTLQLWNGSSAQIGVSSSVIPKNQWVRISLAWQIASTTINAFALFINGVIQTNPSNVTLGTTGQTVLSAGNISGNSQQFYGSDMYIDNQPGLLDPGNIWVTAKRPYSNGTTNGFTTQIGSGGSGYGTGHSPQVNERPASQTNGWSMVGAGSAVTEEYSIEGQSVGDINISGATLIDSMGWVQVKALTAETGTIIVRGVNTNISVTTSVAVFEQTANSATYPAGGTDIGVITSTTVTTFSLYECGVVVAFLPTPIGKDVTPLNNNLGAGVFQAVNRAGNY